MRNNYLKKHLLSLNYCIRTKTVNSFTTFKCQLSITFDSYDYIDSNYPLIAEVELVTKLFFMNCFKSCLLFSIALYHI